MTDNTDNTDANATSESNTPNAAEFVKAVASKTKEDVSVKLKEAVEHSKKGVKTGEMLLEGENQTWRIKAEKTPIFPFPFNIIVSLYRILTGKRILGELIFTNKRVIYVFKSVTFWIFTKQEAYECMMFPRVSSITAGVDHALFGLSKRNSITINEKNRYFFKNVDIASMEKEITSVLDQVKK